VLHTYPYVKIIVLYLFFFEGPPSLRATHRIRAIFAATPCMNMCIYVLTYMCMRGRVSICVLTYMCALVCVCAYMHVHERVCVWTRRDRMRTAPIAATCMNMYMRVCFDCVLTCMCVNPWVYISSSYLHEYVYVCVFWHTCV
jgi:hypothetical protein